MGTVIQLKEQINNSYSDLVNSVEDKLILVEEKITAKCKLKSNIERKKIRFASITVEYISGNFTIGESTTVIIIKQG